MIYTARRVSSQPAHFQSEYFGIHGRRALPCVGDLAARALRAETGRSADWELRYHCRSVLETVVARRRVSARHWAALENAAHAITWVPMRPATDRRELELRFSVPTREHAVVLSLIFGIASGRLWICSKCGRSFVRKSTRHHTCTDCRRATVATTAAGLPWRTVGPRYADLRRRLNLWVHRGQMSREERARRLDAALRDAREVQFLKMSLDDWGTRHDIRERPKPQADT